jgi:hypothetical protein
VIVILGSTQGGAPTQIAGLAIGITLVVIHIFGINITGVSVNPARSLGPALLVGGQALSQVWTFLVVPSIAGIVSGIIFRTKVLDMQVGRMEGGGSHGGAVAIPLLAPRTAIHWTFNFKTYITGIYNEPVDRMRRL